MTYEATAFITTRQSPMNGGIQGLTCCSVWAGVKGGLAHATPMRFSYYLYFVDFSKCKSR